MQKWIGIVAGCGLFLAGFAAARLDLNLHSIAMAQEEKAETKASKADTNPALAKLSEETRAKIKAAADAVNAAVEALKQDQQYLTCTKGINTFGVLTGGIDSVRDLESGLGVDPETFAALYAGLHTDELAEKMGRDSDGRLTFNGRLVRMYPVSRIKALYAMRATITGEEIASELQASPDEPKKPAKKKTEEEPAEGATESTEKTEN